MPLFDDWICGDAALLLPGYCKRGRGPGLSVMQAQHWVAGLTHIQAAVILDCRMSLCSSPAVLCCCMQTAGCG